MPPDSTDLHPLVEELVVFDYICVGIGLPFFVFSLSQIIFHCLHTGILFLHLITYLLDKYMNWVEIFIEYTIKKLDIWASPINVVLIMGERWSGWK